MPMVNLYFPVLGQTLPTDHGYALYGSLARILPVLHTADSTVRIGPVLGDWTGNGTLRLNDRRSSLRLRLPAEQIAAVLPLAGKKLEVLGHAIRLGVPRVMPIIPASALIARLVTIKKSNRQDRAGTHGYMEPAAFLDAARRELERQSIAGQADIPLVADGPHQGKPRRHVLRIRDRRVVGFTLQVTGLTAEESVRLQEHGLGGRKRMGCGFFVPMRC